MLLRTPRIAIAIVLTSIVIVLSPIYFPVGPTKCLPWQHMANAIAGVLLGPFYAAIVAFASGTIRNVLGIGTLYAFPGGIPGAIVVGFAYKYLKKDYAALTEPIGTGLIGAVLSASLVGPIIGSTMTLFEFVLFFSASSIPGSILGFIALLALRRSRVLP